MHMFPSTLNATNTILTVVVNPKVLWVGFAFVFTLTTIMSIVLLYHWSKYGYKPIKTGVTGSIYLIGVIVLLGVLFFAILSYTNSL
jgi:hypothetical protein